MAALPDDLFDPAAPIDEDALDALLAADDNAPVAAPDAIAEAEQARVMAWTPLDLDQADWAGRKWRATTGEMVDVERLAAAQIEKIKAWRDGEVKRLAPRRDFFEGALGRFALGRRAASKVASTKLPSVTVSTRKVNGGLDVTDEAAAIAWAETHGQIEAIKVKKSLLKSQLNVEVDAETGRVFVGEGDERELVPGIEARAGHLTFAVESTEL